MSKRRPEPETAWQRLGRVMVPGTTGGVYTLIPGAISFFVVVALYVHSHFTGKPMPTVTGELLTASLGLMGLHTLRGASADRANAANGLAPVPVDPPDLVVPGSSAREATLDLPALRPVERPDLGGRQPERGVVWPGP